MAAKVSTRFLRGWIGLRFDRVGFVGESVNTVTPWENSDWVHLTMRILDSYQRLVGKALMTHQTGTERPIAKQIARELYEAPFAVLAHNTADDPIFIYGNQTALGLWEVDLLTLLAMPSRQSAETGVQPQRGEMLQRGLERGYIEDYGGVRISSTGRRFRIEGATIWNVFDESGKERIGQAATFSNWSECD